MARIDIELADGNQAGTTLLDLTKQANTLNKEIKKLKPGSEEFINKSKELQGVSSRIGDVKNQIKGTTEASNQLKTAFDKYIPFSGTFKSIGDSMGIAKKGVGGLTGSFGLLRTAIIATGLGALVVVLGSLVAWFSSTQAGMDKVTSVTRPLAAIMQRLLGVLQDLGGKAFKQLSEAINNPRQAFIDLGNVIKENVINRFESLALFGPALVKIFKGDFKEGFKELGNATIQLTTGIENGIDKIADAAANVKKFIDESIEAGTRLDQLQKQIEIAENKQIVRSKQLELVIKQQKAIVEDITRSYSDRIAAAEKARAAQEELERTELALLDLKIAKKVEEHKLNDTSRADDKELAELHAKRLEVQAKITEQSIEFDKKIAEIRARQKAEDLAAQKKLQEELKALSEAEENERREKFQREREELELHIATKQNLLNEQLLSRQLTEEAYYENSAQLAIDFEERKLQIIKDSLGEQSLEYQQTYSNLLKLQLDLINKNDAEFKASIEIQRESLKASVGVLGDFMGSLASFHEQGTQQWKTFATASAIMSAIQGSIAAYSSTAAIPVVGPVLAPIAAGIALAAGYAQVRKIEKTKISSPVKGEKGLVLQGPSHAQGGIPIEAEGDEILLTKGVYRNPILRRVASKINYMAGGRKFEAGGPVNPLNNLSMSMKSRGGNDQGSLLFSAEKPPWVDELIAAQDRRVDRIKVINVVTETADGIKTVNKIIDESNI